MPKPLDQSETSCRGPPPHTHTFWWRGWGRLTLLSKEGVQGAYLFMAVQGSRDRNTRFSFFSCPGLVSAWHSLLWVACACPSLAEAARTSRLSGPRVSTVGSTHTCRQMSTACCTGEVLLLLLSVARCSPRTTDVMAEPLVATVALCFSEGRPHQKTVLPGGVCRG